MTSPALRTAVLGVVVACPAAFPAGALAADPCLSAPVEGQQLQRSGKLRQAHDSFDQCARRSCPPEIVRDCTQWADDVQRATPSVVLAVRRATGGDLTDAQVAIDDQPPVPVSGRAIELDPGPHRFVFTRPGSSAATVDALLREGEKDREIVATLGDASSPGSPSDRSAESPNPRPIPPAAWIAGGVGAAALAVFAVFGAAGVVARGTDHCATGCSASDKSSVDTELRVADVGLAVGVVALGVATWFYLTRPAVSPDKPAALVDVVPTAHGAVLTFGTRF